MLRFRGSTGRRLVAIVLVLAGTLVFTVRLVDLQVVSAGALNEEASGKRAVPVSIPSLRGEIEDRDGEVLAVTDERYDVQLSPKNTRLNDGIFYRKVDSDGVATVKVTSHEAFAEIGALTGQSADDIEKIVDDALDENPKSDFAYVKRSVDLSTMKKLQALRIPWLTFDSNHSRSYPNGAVGGNIIGFAGADSEPQAGVELSQDKCLSGVDGVERYERGADGVALPGSVVVTQEAENGGTVKLTIDRDLQWEAQQIVNDQVDRVSAAYGYITIMNVKTGELVAVAEDGSVDPNDVSAGDPQKREARSFVAPYEPGSTFKTITASALIEEGKATPTSTVQVPSHWEPERGVSFNDSFVHGVMSWTLTGVMAHSSNVGISMLGSRLSQETRYDYLRKFGIGESTKAGMPLEDSGLLHAAEDWDRQTSYNTMFGQGVSSTIVQTAGVYQTIANGGERIPPSIVTSCTDADGTVHTLDHGDPVRVVSKKTAATMMQVLENVVEQSWITPHVSIPGYRVAGKTGTAQQPDGRGGYRSDYVHSFVGIFPADDPQFVIASSIAFPSAGDGGIAAMRGFHDAAEATIRTFHVPPSSGRYTAYPTGD